MQSFASEADLALAHALVAVAAILLAGAALGWVARRAGQPSVIGEVAAGIVLGPSLLGLLPGDLTGRLFPAELRPTLSVVANIGLLLFMFLIGWEFNRRMLADKKLTAGTVSISSVVIAFGLGAGLAALLWPNHDVVDGQDIDRQGFILFIGTAMAITAFPVLARILTDTGLARTRVGTLALASAAVDDVIAWCVLAFVSATVTATGHGDLGAILLLTVAYVLLVLTVLRPLLAALMARLGGRDHVLVVLPVLAGGVFLSAYATTWIGIHAIFGAFLFGFVMPRPDAAGERTTSPAEAARPLLNGVCAVLMPVFFIVTGLNVDISALSPRNYLELAAILGVACAGKFAGACLPARASGMSWRDTAVLGVLMNTRGLTELIILNAGLQLGVLDTEMFTMMVIMALVTTGMAGPLLNRLLREPEPVPARALETRAAG